jgi:hypothetical protein
MPTVLTGIADINLFCQIRSLMHDYLATDGDSSVRSRSEENDARRHLYTGNRDKNKVRRPAFSFFIFQLADRSIVENVQIVRYRA